MYDYAVRVSIESSFLEKVFKQWSESCQKMIVYQHDADDSVNRTHCHMFLNGCKYATPEALKRQFFKLIETTRKGNELWSWREGEFIGEGGGEGRYITYMSKGHLEPIFNKNYDTNYIAECKSKWTAPAKPAVGDSPHNEPKMTKYEIAMKIIDYLVRREYKPEDCADSTILNLIIKELKDNRQCLGMYKVIDIFDCVMMYYNKNKFISSALNILNKRNPY